MNKTLLALYGPQMESLRPRRAGQRPACLAPRIDSFRRDGVSHLAAEGRAFALVTGRGPAPANRPTLRILADHLAGPSATSRSLHDQPGPQANIADFYREMGDLFGVELQPPQPMGRNPGPPSSAGRKHIDGARSPGPILIVDEAQEIQPSVLSEATPCWRRQDWIPTSC